ncbi:MAG: DnaJ domain-containing protein, partial [Candidatus Limnocylindrales bacterium]
MTDPADLYKVLQVDSEADPEVIQAAYRRLARKFHPDLAGDGSSNGGGGDGAGPERAERMIAINAAWEVLRDPHRRAEYDIERERARTASARST